MVANCPGRPGSDGSLCCVALANADNQLSWASARHSAAHLCAGDAHFLQRLRIRHHVFLRPSRSTEAQSDRKAERAACYSKHWSTAISGFGNWRGGSGRSWWAAQTTLFHPHLWVRQPPIQAAADAKE